jgi:hypothetical protein
VRVLSGFRKTLPCRSMRKIVGKDGKDGKEVDEQKATGTVPR